MRNFQYSLKGRDICRCISRGENFRSESYVWRIKIKILFYLYLRKHRKIGLTYIAFSVTVLWLLKIFTGRNIKIANIHL